MSKTIHDSLFELIKSLSKSEKRYFKVYVSRHNSKDSNNNALLFDYLDKADDYVEKEIVKHFKNKAITNSFSIVKRRLYDTIIASLNAYHSNNSVDAQLYKNIQGAAILYQKSLYAQAEKLLNSAHKLASKHERMPLLAEIELQRQQLEETRHYSSIKKAELDEKQTQENYVLEQLQIQSDLWFAKSRLFCELNKKTLLCNEQHKNQLNQYHTYVNELVDNKNLTVSNTYLYHHIEAAYFFSMDDFENTLSHLSRNIDLLEDNLFLLQKYPNYYFGTLSNAVYVAEQLGRPTNELVQKIKTFPTKYNIELSDDLSLKMFLNTSSIELNRFISKGEFIEALKLIPEIENDLRHYGNKIPLQRQLYFTYKFAVVHIGLEDFSGALKWINHILNTSHSDNSEDIIVFTQILNLVLHLELKNDLLLPYTVKNTQRFLKKRNRLNNFEKMMMQFILKYNREKRDFNEQQAWKELYDDILASKDTTEYQIAIAYFDFETWVESKITHQRFGDLVRMKQREKMSKVV